MAQYNPELRKAWIDALRSGKYAQTKNVLHCFKSDRREAEMVVGYCCLGVAAEVARDLGLIDAARFSNDVYCDLIDGDSGVLPDDLAQMLGIYDGALSQGTLAADNDAGRTFSEIADIIEHSPIPTGDAA